MVSHRTGSCLVASCEIDFSRGDKLHRPQWKRELVGGRDADTSRARTSRDDQMLILDADTGPVSVLDAQSDPERSAKRQVSVARLQRGPHRPFPPKAREPQPGARLHRSTKLSRILGKATEPYCQTGEPPPVAAKEGCSEYVYSCLHSSLMRTWPCREPTITSSQGVTQNKFT